MNSHDLIRLAIDNYSPNVPMDFDWESALLTEMNGGDCHHCGGRGFHDVARGGDVAQESCECVKG